MEKEILPFAPSVVCYEQFEETSAVCPPLPGCSIYCVLPIMVRVLFLTWSFLAFLLPINFAALEKSGGHGGR